MKKHWKLLLSTLLLASLVAFTGCGDDDDNGNGNGTTPPNGSGPELGAPARDLGGRVIQMVNWWDASCTETVDWDEISATARERWEDRAEMEQRYNFRIIHNRFGSWQDVRDDFQPRVMAQDRSIQTWAVEAPLFMTNQAAGLIAPIDPAHFDPSYGISWSSSVMELTTLPDQDGRIMPHGFTEETPSAGGVYFNMRLLEEAGIPREAPFDLQASGNWTWATFTDMMHTVALAGFDEITGIRNSWALTTFHTDMFSMALASNGAAYATIDPVTGAFVNATTTDAFRDTIEWMVQLRTDMLAMHEMDVDGEWNAFIQLFDDGQGAFRVANSYVAGNLQVADEWGFVAFPIGPRNTTGNHYNWMSQNFNVFPFFYTEDEIDEMMFAIRAWHRPLEDGDDDDWMIDAFSNHPNERSVTESMALYTRNSEFHVFPAHMMLPATMVGAPLNELFAWRLWSGNDPSAIIEEAQNVWQANLSDANARFNR
jgi:hypothetical protein